MFVRKLLKQACKRCWRHRYKISLFVVTLWVIILISCSTIFLELFEENQKKNEPIELLWWTDNMPPNYDVVRRCGLERCRITNMRRRVINSRIIMFYGSNIKPPDFPLPRKKLHIWTLLHEESPRNVPYIPNNAFLRHFNFSSTFSRYSHMPLTTQYLPRLEDLANMDYVTPFRHKDDSTLYSLAPIVFLQSDCDTLSGREDYVRELMKHIKVDSYGACLKNRDLPAKLQQNYLNNLYSPDLLRFLSPYKFMISIENGVCDDYITEKYWRPLMLGIIPIYFGAPHIRDWEPHEKSAIYVDDFASPADLVEFIKEIQFNETEYNSYLRHKYKPLDPIENTFLVNTIATRKYSVAIDQSDNGDDSLFANFECYMCRLFNKGNKYLNKEINVNTTHYNCPYPPSYAPLGTGRIPENSVTWHSVMSIGRCQAALLDKLIIKNQKFTQNEFDMELRQKVRNNLCG